MVVSIKSPGKYAIGIGNDIMLAVHDALNHLYRGHRYTVLSVASATGADTMFADIREHGSLVTRTFAVQFDRGEA